MDAKLFKSIVRCTDEIAATWAGPIDAAMQKWEIRTPMRQAMFMAQMCVESGNFTRFQENLNYGAQGLANTWPSRFAVDPKAQVKVPTALAFSIERKPRLIALSVYSDRMGNGPAATGDAWTYRGRGPKQITGKHNYGWIGPLLGVDIIANPDLLLQVEYGAQSAAAYWGSTNCNALADALDYQGVTRAINGGLIGYAQRVVSLNLACDACRLPRPPVPQA